MKIGIDARFYDEAGPGRYVKNLIFELEKIDQQNSYKIFLKDSNFNSYQPSNPKFSKIKANYHWYSLTEQLLFPIKIWQSGVDLMHFTQFNIPVFWPGPFVVTIHDMIMHEYSTERDTTRHSYIYKIKKLAYLFVFWWACRRAIRVLVPSLATRDDLINKLKIRKDKISVTYEGVGGVEEYQREDLHPSGLSSPNPKGVNQDAKILEQYGVDKPYLLYVGSMYPHKNLERMLRAFKILINRFNFPGKLVIIGKESDFSRRLRNLVAEEKLSNRVIFPGSLTDNGYLSDSETYAFYREALLFIFPSLKEGFGLPPLEAMKFGIPVTASKVSCIPEVCSSAAQYFDPLSIDDMAARINEVVSDGARRKMLIEAGYKRIKDFSWKVMAKQTLSTYLGL